ncbi:hypothetical protein D9M71_706580 [compost metagenome]
MRNEPAVFMAAASFSLTLAISTALKVLARLKAASSTTASPARAGSELFSQLNMVLPPKSPGAFINAKGLPTKRCNSLIYQG